MIKREKHGMSKESFYWVWINLKVRCNKKNHPSYKNYGGRGISYDNKWENFSGFWNDMKQGYKDGLTLDRIDNDGNYCKENCRWTTQKEQQNNKRKRKDSVFLTLNEKTQTMSDWSREINIDIKTLWRRKKMGWDDFKALTTPVKNYKLKE